MWVFSVLLAEFEAFVALSVVFDVSVLVGAVGQVMIVVCVMVGMRVMYDRWAWYSECNHYRLGVQGNHLVWLLAGFKVA